MSKSITKCPTCGNDMATVKSMRIRNGKVEGDVDFACGHRFTFTNSGLISITDEIRSNSHDDREGG